MPRISYPSDLTDEQWRRIEPLIPAPKPGGRPREVEMRKVIDAILYINRTGCQWRALPHDLPAWGTVADYFYRFRDRGVWQTIHDHLRQQTRVAAGKDPTPSAAIIDSQSVKTTEKGGRGYDAGKKISGSKRHIVVDTLGLILAVAVHAASIQDRDGAGLVLARLAGLFPRLKLIWADGGYAGKLIERVKELGGWTLQIVKRSDKTAGLVVLPRRWIVERTFGWLGRCRRLSKDYQWQTPSSEAMIHIAMISLMLHRLQPETA